MVKSDKVFNKMKNIHSQIIVQTKLDKRISIAKAICDKCQQDYFDIIEKGKNKDLLCEECE